jgi:hypothetical protein
MTNKPDENLEFKPQKVMVQFEDGSSYPGWSHGGSQEVHTNADGSHLYMLLIRVEKINDQ